MVEGVGERGGRGQEGIHTNSLFCADDGMVKLLDPRCLQGAFSTLVGLLNRVGLQTNYGKTVDMVFRTCQAAGMQSEAAYRRRMTGEVPWYQERQRGRIQCKK